MEYILTDLLGGFGEFLSRQDFFILLIAVYILSIFVYWLASKYLHKLRNDIFDSWFFMTALTLIWGRLAYVIVNWTSFVQSYWFYLPYEKYPNVDQIFWFRTMPWKLITIWDGGFLYSAMLAALMLGALIFILRVKRWPIRENLGSIAMSIASMMGGIFFLYGMYLGGNFEGDNSVFLNITSTGLILLISVVIMLFWNWIWSKNYSLLIQKQKNIRDVINGIYLVAVSYFTVVTLFAQTNSTMDLVNVYVYLALLALTLLAAIFGVNEDEDSQRGRETLQHTKVPVRNRAIKSDLLNS
jgi:hypothetical protein